MMFEQAQPPIFAPSRGHDLDLSISVDVPDGCLKSHWKAVSYHVFLPGDQLE